MEASQERHNRTFRGTVSRPARHWTEWPGPGLAAVLVLMMAVGASLHAGVVSAHGAVGPGVERADPAAGRPTPGAVVAPDDLHVEAASVAVCLRLVVAAAVSFGLAWALGLGGLTRQTLILENSMPSAILGLALAQEFDAAPELVTKVIFLSTLAGLVTLTVLLTIV